MSKGEETRRRIVTEAAALFNQHGFEGGSLSDLMKATGLEKGVSIDTFPTRKSWRLRRSSMPGKRLGRHGCTILS
jgi:hypothetical protein